MKISQILSSQSQSKSRRVSLAEKIPFFMGRVTIGGSLHPLAEKLYGVVLTLYKGQSDDRASEKTEIKALSDLLNNGICEWASPDNFKRYSEIDQDILELAIEWMRSAMLETQEELKAHLLPTHLKRAVRSVCGGMSYTQAIGTALACIEAGLTKHSSVPQIVWNAAMKFKEENKNYISAPTSVKEDSHEIPGFQLRGFSAPRKDEPERRNDHRATESNTAFSSK